MFKYIQYQSSLDTPTHSMVFLYFYYCRIIVKISKLWNNGMESWVCNTNMFQADHHSPCDQVHEGNLLKWLQTRSIHICSHEVLWKAGIGSHQHHYPKYPRPTPICIPPKQIHRWWNLYCTPHCPFTPGQKEHLCENAVHWLQLSFEGTMVLNAEL